MSKRVTPVSENGLVNRIAGTEKPPAEMVISPPNMKQISITLVGTTPLVQNRFGNKARNMIVATQEAGSQGRKGKKREAKDFDECFEQARHISTEGWDGIHAGGFRRAMVDACGIVGFHMTKGKKCLFVVADGLTEDGEPLVKITKGTPRKVVHPVRNATGVVDMRARPMWDTGWEAVLTIRFDADMFTVGDIVNLVARVGVQCGVGEGRPNSKDSTGCDWGLFRIEGGPTPEQPA